MLSRQVALQDVLRTVGVPLLRIQRRTRHVRYHGVAAAEGVLGVPQRVVLRGRLREPHVAAVATKVARLERRRDVLLDDDGAASRVDEPGAWDVLERTREG